MLLNRILNLLKTQCVHLYFDTPTRFVHDEQNDVWVLKLTLIQRIAKRFMSICDYLTITRYVEKRKCK